MDKKVTVGVWVSRDVLGRLRKLAKTKKTSPEKLAAWALREVVAGRLVEKSSR